MNLQNETAVMPPLRDPTTEDFALLEAQTAVQWLEHIQHKDTNLVLAEAACHELYRRYARRLLAAANNYTHLGPDFDPQAHVHETFLRAFRKAHTFKCPPDVTAPEDVENQVLCWLFRILSRLISDFIKAQYSRRQQIAELLRSNPLLVGESLSGIGWRQRLDRYRGKLRIIREWFLTLNEREKEIVQVSYRFWKEGSDCVIPRDIRAHLCERLNISEENLRVIRSRLVKDMRLFMMSKENPPIAKTL